MNKKKTQVRSVHIVDFFFNRLNLHVSIQTMLYVHHVLLVSSFFSFLFFFLSFFFFFLQTLDGKRKEEGGDKN